jgi:hypothetical protein
MTKFDEIKTAISQLPEAEIARLRDWFAEIDAQKFDEKIERDAATGKLDGLIAKARANHAAGRFTKL